MRFVVALGFAALATSASAKPNETETAPLASGTSDDGVTNDGKPGVAPLDPASKDKTDAKHATSKTDAKHATSKTDAKHATSKDTTKTDAKVTTKTDATKTDATKTDATKTDATPSDAKADPSTKSTGARGETPKTSSTKTTTTSKSTTSKSTTSKTTTSKTTTSKTPTTTAKRSSSKKRATKKYDQSHVVAINEATKTPAYRYGQLDDHDCFAELDARKIPYTRESATRGIRSPLRLTGALHGVTFKTELPEKQRATTIWEIGDCRLVLAMDDFASILATHDVVEVKHYSMYRLPPKGDGDKQGTRHNGGLALDAAKFITKTGTTLVVDKDFGGKIDAPTCGVDAKPNPSTAEAIELRKILCETVDQHLFNVVLTPNYNKPHHNHFHLEVTAGVKWFLVH